MVDAVTFAYPRIQAQVHGRDLDMQSFFFSLDQCSLSYPTVVNKKPQTGKWPGFSWTAYAQYSYREDCKSGVCGYITAAEDNYNVSFHATLLSLHCFLSV